MTNPKGTPLWYEYLATDLDQAHAFYASMFNWTVRDSGMEGMDYRLTAAPGGADVGGLMKHPGAGEGAPPTWLIYFATDDVDADAALATQLGGSVMMPPMDIPGVGRFAMLTDPQGHPFYVMKGESGDPSTAFMESQGACVGHGVWNELTAEDQDAAMAFYQPLLGLRHVGAMPMGPLGDYKFIGQGGDMDDNSGCVAVGASMNAFPGARRGWQVYFAVDDVDAAVERLNAGGGKIIQGPDQIPGGDYSVVAEDPAGARFGFVGKRV